MTYETTTGTISNSPPAGPSAQLFPALPPLSDAVVARDGHVVATAGDVWCLRRHAEGGGMLETDSGLLDADLCAGGARQGMRRRGAGGPRGRASCRR